MAILVTRLATAVSSRKKPKMAINRDFPGLRAFSANVVARQKRRARNSASDGQKYARFGAPRIELWPFQSPGWPRPRGKFSSRKTPKMAINRDFPGLRAFSARCCGRQKRRCKKFLLSVFVSQQHLLKMHVEPREIEIYGHFGCHPAGHGRFKPKNTQNGNKSRFPGATCIFSKCCGTFDKNEDARNSCIFVFVSRNIC